MMKRRFIFALVLFALVTSTQAFSQSSNGTISGTITDPSGAVLPEVTVTATNTGTGVVMTEISNSAGVYNFVSLQPGVYKVDAELKGFQGQVFTDVQLGNVARLRLNFSLQISKLAEMVEVSVAGDQLLLESSSSVGGVIPEKQVQDLPLVGENTLDLVKVMGGAIVTQDAIFGESMGSGGGATSFAGVSAVNINVQRDGTPVSDVRWPTGINGTTRINPDLVEEVSVVLTPVDAEAGRGNGQVRIETKGGTNRYHGSAVFNGQNSFLDTNTWSNNRSGIEPNWRNLDEYTLSLGGPIIKNKTFFFVLWDGQLDRTRQPRQSLVLTPCAQKGIFRYFDNWNNGNIHQVTTGGATPTIAVVDANGNPVVPTVNPDGSPFTGKLEELSVFGPLSAAAQAQLASDPINCSQYLSGGLVTGSSNGFSSSWDPYRTGIDPTGYISKFLGWMPKANNYEIGDGLNTVGSRWNQTLYGADNLYGVGEDTQRKQFNMRIDHNFSQRQRIAVAWSYESDWASDSFANWPTNSFGGLNERRPQVLTVNFISTFTPSLLNEARMGMSRTGGNELDPLKVHGQQLSSYLPEINGTPIIVGPGTGNVNFSPDCFLYCPPNAVNGMPSNPYGGRGLVAYDGYDTSSRWTFGDTLSWTKGAHSFKFGGEYRADGSYGATGWVFNSTFSDFVPNPFAAGGAAPYAPVTGISSANMPGLAGFPFAGNDYNMQSLLDLLAGSMADIRQYYYINKPTQTNWSDQTQEPYPIRNFHQNEWSGFFKDDWKALQNLTLNLGIRWDYYGVPYMKSGMTAGFVGGGSALFGISGRTWQDAFWNPGVRAAETTSIFIGPDSPNSGQSVYSKDLHDFGPAVGFAWQMPWLGKGKTTLRGGYQISYVGIGRESTVDATLGTPPGSTYDDTYVGDPVQHPYLNMTSLTSPVPLPAGIVPMTSIPLTDRSTDITAFDQNYRTPYIQSLVLALTRNITPNLQVDVRYVGTLSRKLMGEININAPNFLHNGLLQALNAARSGGESSLLDSMLSPVSGGLSGAEFLRESAAIAPSIGDYTSIQTDLANGNFAGVAQKINFLGYPNGQWLRSSGNFPENFIMTNPQYYNATFLTNSNENNYHSMQAQITLRPRHGIGFQATYTWSRNLGITGTPTDPSNLHADYSLLPSNRSHVFVAYGTWDLPFGPKHALLGSASPVLGRIVGGWQLSWIVNAETGTPLSIGAANMLYANGVPDKVGPFDYSSVGTDWPSGATAGNFFGNRYHKVLDPQCSAIASELQPFCTLQAVADSNNQIIFQNPQPGMRGNFGRNNITGPAYWSTDLAASKSIRIAEGKSFMFRLDASNLFNHPQASYGEFDSGTRIIVAQPPDVNINDGNPFGYLSEKVGTRTFQVTARLNF